jgi:hypothetical protein
MNRHYFITDYPLEQLETQFRLPPLSHPKTRAGKITQFKHYQTDAPV